VHFPPKKDVSGATRGGEQPLGRVLNRSLKLRIEEKGEGMVQILSGTPHGGGRGALIPLS